MTSLPQCIQLCSPLFSGTRDIKVLVKGTVNATIEEGAYVEVVVKIGHLKLFQHRYDLCEELQAKNHTVQCPIEPGNVTVEYDVHLENHLIMVCSPLLTRRGGSKVESSDLTLLGRILRRHI